MFRSLLSVRVTCRVNRTLATHAAAAAPSAIRHDWSKLEIQQIYDSPLLDLVFRAASVHRLFHDPAKLQLCTLMNIKSTSFHAFLLHIKSKPVFQPVDALRTVRLSSPRKVSHLDPFQVHIVRNHLATTQRQRHRNWLTSNPFFKLLGKPRRTEALDSAWVPLGEISPVASEVLREYYLWYERFVRWAWKFAQLWACSLPSKPGY
jgi:hypothetical protein